MKELTEAELIELEKQLMCPTGDIGIQVAENMHQTNIGMTTQAIEAMNLADNYSILELGHGNCGHLPLLLSQGNNIQYHGLEISETMYQAAQQLNQAWITQGAASFSLYNGINIPFKNELFDGIMAVNNIYFWQEPINLLKGIHSILKPKGRLIIAFVQKEMMKTLPFVRDKFQLYDQQLITTLANKTGFKVLDCSHHTEDVKSKAGEFVNRKFGVAVLQPS